MEHNPNERCRYTHVIAETNIGPVRIEWKGWKDHPSFDVTFPWEGGYETLFAYNVREAKMEVEDRWQKVIGQLLEEE